MGNPANILIIGPGSIGLALGARLVAAGYGVGFRGRNGDQPARVRLVGHDGNEVVHEFPAPRFTPALVIVTVKAYDLAAALDEARTLGLPVGTPVWPLANGAVEDVVKTGGGTRLGFSNFAVSALDDGRYALRSKSGGVHVGPLVPGTAKTPVEAAITKDPFFTWHDPIQPHQHKKWLFNTVINTLTAARGLARNGDLLADVPTLTAVFAEAFALGRAMWGEWPAAQRELYDAAVKLIEATAANENSMARDKRLGRKTESAFLAGLATDAKKYPLLTSLHAKIEGR